MIHAARGARESLGIVEAAQAKAAAVYAGLRLRGVAPERAAAKTSGQYGAAFTVYTADPPAIPPDRHVKAWRAWRARIEAYSAAHAAALPPAPIGAGSLPAAGNKAAGTPIRVAPAPTIAEIKEIVGELSGVTESQFVGQTRTQRVAGPRQIAISLCKRWGGWSSAEISRCFGHRDHTTMLHAAKSVRGRLDASDPDTVDMWEKANDAIHKRWPFAVASEVWHGGEAYPMKVPRSTKPEATKAARRYARKYDGEPRKSDGVWKAGA